MRKMKKIDIDRGVTNKLGVSPKRVSLTPVPISKNQVKILKILASGILAFSIIKRNIKKNINLSRSLKQLIKRRLVAKEDSSKHYFLTEFGKKWLLENCVNKTVSRVSPNDSKGYRGVTKSSKTKSFSSDIRSHNVRVKWKIKSHPKGWRESPKEFFEEQNVKYTPLGLKNVDGVQFTMTKCTVKATSKHIVVILNEFYYEDAVDFMPIFKEIAFSMRNRLQRKFRNLIFNDYPIITVGETANENDILAKLREKHGYQVIKHTDGRNRIIFDFSKGHIELEFTHRGMFDEDQEIFKRRLPQFIDSRYDYDQVVLMAEQAKFENKDQDSRIEGLIDAGEKLAKANSGIIKNQEYYAENMVSHVKAVQNLGSGVEQMTSKIEQLTNLIELLVKKND